MSRITAPVSKLARTMASSATPAAASAAARPMHDISAHSAGDALLPKYAELLRNRRSSDVLDSSRGLTTTHRPTPQPSLANRPKPLMQTFHSTAPSSATAAVASHLDATVVPSMATLFSAAASPRVPILPDNYYVAHGAAGGPSPSETLAVSIIAADPSKILPGAPLLAVEGLGLDGFELKFVHEDHHNSQARTDDHGGGMIRDMWKGMADKVLRRTE